MPATDETSKKIAHAKAVAAEAQDTAARVQSRIQDMQKHLEQWQGQYGGLRSQDLGQVVLDAGRSGGPRGPLMGGWGVARDWVRPGCRGHTLCSLQCPPWRRRCRSC